MKAREDSSEMMGERSGIKLPSFTFFFFFFLPFLLQVPLFCYMMCVVAVFFLSRFESSDEFSSSDECEGAKRRRFRDCSIITVKSLNNHRHRNEIHRVIKAFKAYPNAWMANTRTSRCCPVYRSKRILEKML